MISINAINEYCEQSDIYRLHDKTSPKLYFTYSKVAREKNKVQGTWYLVYYDKRVKRSRWSPFAKYPEVSPANARKALPPALLALSKQLPNKAVANIACAGNVVTVADAVNYYLQDKEAQIGLSGDRKKSLRGYIDNHIIPNIGEIEIASLSISQVRLQLAHPLMEKLRVSTAKKVMSTLLSSLAFVYTELLISENPLKGLLAREWIAGKVAAKDIRINQNLLGKMLKRADQDGVRVPMWALLKILTLTFNRIGETVKSRWAHIDFSAKEWRLPGTTTKSGRPHVIYMSDELIAVLKTLRKYQNINGRSVFLFPSQRKHGAHIRPDSASAKVSGFAMFRWSAHDLRKFARTWAFENGIDERVGEYLLGHQLTEYNKTYVQSNASSLCREALAKWGMYIGGLSLYN